MATQAKVTFTSLNGDSNLSERVLTLNPHLRNIQIGRASKTPSKGLQAAVDNAWFDSPVMSRNHAEISLDAESKTITIRDIGSMHGTFVNSFQLRQHEPRELVNGDLVVFGVEVKRNLDTFPACAFSIGYEFLPFKSTISYAFPESDDDDYDLSADEEHGEPSSEDGVSIESPPQKVSQAINAIDLTRDDSPASSEVECTGESSVEKKIMAVKDGRPADIDNNADPVSVTFYTGNTSILVDSDDGDANFSSDSDDQSEVDYGDDVSSGEDSMNEQDEQDSQDGDDGIHETDEEDENASEPGDFPGKESEQASGLANLELHSSLNQPLPESNLRTIIDATENILEEEDHDDESEFELSDAGAEGIRALFDDDGLVYNAGDSYFKEDHESNSYGAMADEALAEALMTDDTLESPKRVTFARLPSENLPEMTSGYSHFNAFAQSSLLENSLGQGAMNIRQPSPSDAAMVKIATPSSTLPNDSANPVRVHHLPSQTFQKLTAQSLGDKTGKHAFFAAREDNRAKIYSGDQSGRSSSSPQMAKSGVSSADDRKAMSLIAQAAWRDRKRRREEEAKSKLSESAKSLPVTLPAIRAVNSTIRLFSGPSYLHDHTQAPNFIRHPSPEPDMTSAVTYNESKASMVAANNPSSNPPGRYGLSINDIIEGAAGGHTSKAIKRKAGDISEAIEDEIRVWASSSSAVDHLKGSTATSASAPQAAICEEQSQTAPTIVAGTPEQRPAKRLRKIVESVGYVALGGVTLFGALVLSAPDFL